MSKTLQTKATQRSSAVRVEHTSRPVWMAVLLASSCQAVSEGREHPVSWAWIADHAVYSNMGDATEIIQPLGVSLESGYSLAVHWAPSETSYTLETYRPSCQYVA